MTAIVPTMSHYAHLVKMAHHHGGGTPEEMAEVLIDPYDSAEKYARAAIYFLAIVIGLFTLNKIAKTFNFYRHQALVKPAALFRYVSARQTRKTVFGNTFPAMGVLGMIVAFWLFIGIWTLAQRPYYRSKWSVGSPPLAIRTGMFALGCFPFILAFGSKWNIVTFTTGYSHEKLQVFHQWLSHLFLLLSFLHTFPFVVQGLHDTRPNDDGLNPMGLKQIQYSWHIGKVYYWSGTAALIPLCWLCWASLPFFRSRQYEIFKLLHVISAILFTAFFYIHCNKLLNSWPYIYATIAIYGVCVLARFGLMAWRNGRKIPRARLESLPDDMVRIVIDCPPTFQWAAGQHYYLNFINCRPLESHPFTVANSPKFTPGTNNDMVILARAHTGLTSRLERLNQRGDLKVLLDGPYGGLTADADLAEYDHAILLASGVGATFIFALLEKLARNLSCGRCRIKTVEVVWVVRKAAALEWFDQAMTEALKVAPAGSLSLRLFVTGSNESPQETPVLSQTTSTEFPDKASDSDDEKDLMAEPAAPASTTQYFRPSLGEMIGASLYGREGGSAVGVAACGKEEFIVDVRNAVAAAQLDILKGRLPLSEVFLHTESFAY